MSIYRQIKQLYHPTAILRRHNIGICQLGCVTVQMELAYHDSGSYVLLLPISPIFG
jgi:hypothetical protein